MRRLGPWLAVLFFAVLAALEITHGVTRLGAIRRARAQEIVDGAAQAQSDLAAELRAQGTEGRRHAGYVARLPAVGALLRGGAEASRPILSGQVLAQLASFPEIDRVRVLSEDGREVFRCERMGGGAAAIPEPLLAREPDLAALELAVKLEPGGVAISGLFLDRERVEVPESERKVIHHVAKPPEPGLRGCVVVTMYASPILDRVRTFVPVEGSRSMLVTRSGDYVASPDRAQEMGAPTASNLTANHPEAAPVLRGANRVQTDDGVFLAASAGELPWLVVTAIPDAALTGATRQLSRESGLVIAGMIATLVLILIAAIVFHRLALRAFRLREAEAALRQLEEKREMERRLATAERLSSLGLLTAGVAHEINNPLEGIGNYLTLLDDEQVAPDKRRRYVSSVRHGFERIREVVRNLLGFARPVRGAGSADLRRVIANAAELARFSTEGRDVTLEAPPGDEPVMVAGDAGALEQVLLNLFLNAGRAMGGHGRITVSIERSDDGVAVRVDDEGPGIPPENLGRIFDPFFTTGEGSGLGLSVSYGIAQAHGGSLAAENRQGGGARFTLTLPAAAIPARAAVPAERDVMKATPTILVVDDEAYVRDSVIELIESRGFKAVGAANVAAAVSILGAEPVDAVLTDLKMPGGSGLDLLDAVRSSAAPAPVIVMTGVGTISDAVKAMKGGAYDFLQKPVDPEQLAVALQRALEHRGLVKEVQALRSALGRETESETLAGATPAIARVRALIQQVSATETTVLITGESGVGKELAAAEIHRRSSRRSRNLVRVNCAAIPDSLFESEFFGHRRGAFSGAIADRVGRFQEAEGGTIVLDEIGSLKPEMQAKLLRILESGEFQVVGESRTRVADVRVIGVSNEDLPGRVRDGTFRADLFYRLNVFPIEVPPLRQRPEDIGEISSQLLVRLRGRGRPGDPPPRLSPEVVTILESYGWPGNIRELKNVIERALIVAGEREPDAALFRNILEATLPTEQPGIRDCQLRTNLDAVEKQLITKALAQANGVKKDASALLGIDPKNLGYYLRKHGIEGGQT